MIVLGLDTATEVLSVALAHSEAGWSHTVVSDRGLRHTDKLMSLVDALLDQTQLSFEQVELVACSRGPGSFTGLRIGMATAKGLAEAVASRRGLTDPPMVSIPTLAVMATALPPTGLVAAVIDARKGRYYAALAREGTMAAGPVDLAATETLDALLEHDEAARGDRQEMQTLVVTGPHAAKFVAEVDRTDGQRPLPKLVVDPHCRRGWALAVAHAAPQWLAKNGPDSRDAGPQYVRISDAEIGINRS